MTLDWFFQEAWRWAVGLPESHNVAMPSLDELRKSEWSPEFEQLMRNRLIIGAFRYGRFGTPRPQYDRMASITKRAGLYATDGNLEHLVDIANLALVEFVEGRHPLRHFAAQDDVIHADRSTT